MSRNTPSAPGHADDDMRLIPALIPALREGYGLARLRADTIAALTVAIVALPLSMAIAIAAGGTPAMGLYTAIAGGFFVSALGGSRHQIGGPAGAFIVLMATTVALHGIDGLILATAMSGVMLTVLGLLRLGSYIKFVPYPVTVGFTAGIAVIIFASQIKEILGLTLTAPEPGPLLEKLPVIWASLPTLNPATLALSAGTVAIIVALKRTAPRLPGLLLAVIAITLVAMLGNLPVATIGSVFGELPSTVPLPALPEISVENLRAVLPSAIAFTLLGAIESLLSAIVADGMTGRRHNSNMELVAQGVANVASALVGGMAVTGTIARTATNVRAGGITPVSGILHAVFILVFVLVAAPLASFIPLAALAGVLAVVAWNMVEREAIRALLRASRGDAAVLLVTFFLTIFRDLTEAIVVGFALGAVLFIHRMSSAIEVRAERPFPTENDPDNSMLEVDPDIVIYQIRGAFFFGSVASISSVLDRIAAQNRGLILDFSEVIFTDSSAANLIEGMVHKARRNDVAVVLACTDHATRVQLFAQGIKPPLVQYQPSVARAKQALRRRFSK